MTTAEPLFYGEGPRLPALVLADLDDDGAGVLVRDLVELLLGEVKPAGDVVAGARVLGDTDAVLRTAQNVL